MDREKLQEEISINTIRHRIKDWVDNFFANLPSVKAGKGITILDKCLINVPAIIVASGPSLDKNISLLASVQDKACILACDSSLRACLAVGVKPHIVVSADSKQRVIKYLQGVDTSDLLLVADTFIHPETVKAWKGQVLWYNTIPVDTEPFTHVLYEWTGQIGFLGSGGSVTTTAFCLAKAIIECDPIIFIGQDCSYSDPNVHHANCVKDTEQFVSDRIIIEKDIFGNDVYTSPPLQSFKYWFEDIFRAYVGIYINCTEGGILKENILQMPFVKCIESYLVQTYKVGDKLREAVDGNTSKGGKQGLAGEELETLLSETPYRVDDRGRYAGEPLL